MDDRITPATISTNTATIMPAASPRASASMIMRPMPCSAPMNSPTITPISENEIAGVILSSLVRRLQAYLLRWRPAQTATGT